MPRLLPALPLLAVACTTPDLAPVRGVHLTAWQAEAYLDPQTADTIDRWVDLGATHLVVLTTWYQDDATDPAGPRPTDRTPTDESLRHALRLAHDRGLQTVLKPHVDLLDDAWRGTIRPPDVDAWFDTYRAMVHHHADLATETGAGALVVGTELSALVDREDAWRTTVAQARDRYDGPILYAANWDRYADIRWWDAVDRLGVDAYMPLTDRDDPTPERLARVWRREAAALGRFARREGVDLWLTELGVQSRDGANRTPWWSDGPQDLDEQAHVLEAALEAVDGEPWIAGALLWRTAVDPSADLDGFDILGKPAEEAVARAWSTP